MCGFNIDSLALIDCYGRGGEIKQFISFRKFHLAASLDLENMFYLLVLHDTS